MNTEGIKLCREYLFSLYVPGDPNRVEKHHALCDYYKIDHEKSKQFTDNLDGYIGYDTTKDIFEQDIDELCIRLDTLMRICPEGGTDENN